MLWVLLGSAALLVLTLSLAGGLIWIVEKVQESRSPAAPGAGAATPDVVQAARTAPAHASLAAAVDEYLGTAEPGESFRRYLAAHHPTLVVDAAAAAEEVALRLERWSPVGLHGAVYGERLLTMLAEVPGPETLAISIATLDHLLDVHAAARTPAQRAEAEALALAALTALSGFKVTLRALEIRQGRASPEGQTSTEYRRVLGRAFRVRRLFTPAFSQYIAHETSPDRIGSALDWALRERYVEPHAMKSLLENSVGPHQVNELMLSVLRRIAGTSSPDGLQAVAEVFYRSSPGLMKDYRLATELETDAESRETLSNLFRLHDSMAANSTDELVAAVIPHELLTAETDA